MKFLLILILGLQFLWGCDRSEVKAVLSKQGVVIAGQIDTVTAKTISIVFSDLVRGSAHFTQVLDPSTGIFNFKFDIYHAQDVLLKYDQKNITLYVDPSDSLFITFSLKDFNKKSDNKFTSIQFFGRSSSVNKEMLAYSVFSKTPGFQPNIDGKSAKLYLSELTEHMEKENKELDKYILVHKPSPKFINWARNDIIYTHANYLIYYKAYLAYNNLPRNDSLFDLTLFPVTNKESLVSSLFGVHLWHYVTDRYMQRDSTILADLDSSKYFEAYDGCITAVLENEPAGILRDIMIYKLLSSLFDESFDDFKKIWIEKNEILSNPLLISELEFKTVEKENEKDYGIALLNSASVGETEFIGDVLSEIINESENTLIYLDIWATWCGPCLAEIPDIIELHEKVRDENIEIISLCLNSQRSLWKQIVQKNNIPGKHFFLDKSQSEVLSSKLKFDGFPTYMVIKDGKILNEHAPRPSSGDVILKELRNIERISDQ